MLQTNFCKVKNQPVTSLTPTLKQQFPGTGLNFPLIFLIICSCKWWKSLSSATCNLASYSTTFPTPLVMIFDMFITAHAKGLRKHNDFLEDVKVLKASLKKNSKKNQFYFYSPHCLTHWDRNSKKFPLDHFEILWY